MAPVEALFFAAYSVVMPLSKKTEGASSTKFIAMMPPRLCSTFEPAQSLLLRSTMFATLHPFTRETVTKPSLLSLIFLSRRMAHAHNIAKERGRTNGSVTKNYGARDGSPTTLPLLTPPRPFIPHSDFGWHALSVTDETSVPS